MQVYLDGLVMGNFKKELFEQFAYIAKAMASGHRLEMLEFLAQCEYSVEELASAVGLSVANTSHHLQQLRHAGRGPCIELLSMVLPLQRFG